MKNDIKRKRIHTTPLKVFIFIYLLVWSITFITCLVWMILNSLKDRVDFLVNPLGIPKTWHFENYINAFTELEALDSNLIEMFFNTLWLTAGTVFLSQLSSTTFAYVIARYKFPGRKVLYWTTIARMMIVLVGTLPGTYKLYDALGILDTPLILVTNLTGMSGFLIYYAVFKGVPKSFVEAAYIDGYDEIRIFFKIMYPQIYGILIANVVSIFIGTWNDYLTPIMFLPSYPTIASGIYTYQISSARNLNYPVLFSALFMMMVPCIIMFVIFQKNFLEIDISGGLKE